jgi:hypothetical protein
LIGRKRTQYYGETGKTENDCQHAGLTVESVISSQQVYNGDGML